MLWISLRSNGYATGPAGQNQGTPQTRGCAAQDMAWLSPGQKKTGLSHKAPSFATVCFSRAPPRHSQESVPNLVPLK